MKKVIRLTESDLMRIVKRVIKESDEPSFGNINLEAIEGFYKEAESFDDVDNFLEDVFPNKETYLSDVNNFYKNGHKLFNLFYRILERSLSNLARKDDEEYGTNNGGYDPMDYLESWAWRTERLNKDM